MAFPTETVYGLGARLDDESLAKIFAAKARPYSDPLICHFDTPEAAKQYVRLTPEEDELFDRLSTEFWPGPLTIIGPATSAVPPLVMAGTGCVGVRVPSHVVAHHFLALCGEPVAAPSANLFGHVSPTSAEHVNNDLGKTEGLLIVSGGKATIGIESTVVRIVGGKIAILRPGFVTAGQIERLCPGRVKAVDVDEDKADAPGHEKRHYAPNMRTLLVRVDPDGEAIPEKAVMIDFHRTFAKLSTRVLRYFDLSPIGSIEEAIGKLYDVLREAELTTGAEVCLIADVATCNVESEGPQRELLESIRDRLMRAASHELAAFKIE